MATTNIKRLHWTQRIALVRHNLHCASRSGDFGFFKALQAAGLMEGTNHFATLTASMGDDADTLLAAMDNLNGGLAYIHQDAFEKVYENLKNSVREDGMPDRAKIYVDITMQKNVAAAAIDKLSSSAIALIQSQPIHFQDEAANVYIAGLTLAADCVEVVTKQLNSIDSKMDDFVRLEDSWNTVKGSVVALNASLKGVFYLMDATDPQGDKAAPSHGIASAGSAMFRRLSTAFQSPPPPPPKTSRSSSVVTAGASSGSLPSEFVYRTPDYVRNSVSHGCPTSLPSMNNFQAFNANAFNLNGFQSHKLTTIPPTPADESTDPFDTSVSDNPLTPLEETTSNVHLVAV
ncbi:uncharacterized protein RCC_01844 [Ramularia collo-cygni]|uniref:Uncharacterized protein n=1 Tax=Ramularia collo-cygni TaxID=112498 RepID=A0A2D3V0K8_9PEZI|nr:uncharacterized protein RCC_01844 [Ramularia collo-cygni]CZT16004.1 uncharacterized protein RCC_01844 [Ramularia collo-cygni]